MGIESDQVVYEYLGRVADLAQRQLPAATRLRLVSELRSEIDRRRAKGGTADNPAAVRRILDRLGTPDEIVAAASDGTTPASRTTAAPEPSAVPHQRTGRPGEPGTGDRPKGLRRVVPRPRPTSSADRAPNRAPADAASPPHLAPAHELGDSRGERPDWWRVEPGGGQGGPFGFEPAAAGFADDVPGFTGGVEIPEMLKPPPVRPFDPTKGPSKGPKEEVEGGGVVVEDTAVEDDTAGRPRFRLPRGNPLLLVAALLLLGGAVLGNWIALGLGWLIAYVTRRLTPTESKWAVMVLPGVAAGAGVVWLWGRSAGRWGDPIAQGQMNVAVDETWPWVVRGAALASAAYLLWRARRL
ncbi:hypothetical protein OK074_8876 [Actinobacteria bacterium OK074]|nr:hypothetical protein OK074_8876 [Actinobacteria bacterium OK074]